MTTAQAFSFPQGFLWGAATAAHQVEGNNVHSDWWAWEQAGRVRFPSGLACGHYQRFAQDFDLAAQLGHNAHRFSIEWSRLEPEEGRWDDEALAHYVDVVRALRQRRLEPIVTLHHFTTPQWLTREGGWVNPIVVERFARFTERVAKALRGEVRYWITINEPMVFVKAHYVVGEGPPGRVGARSALRVIEHLIRAHALSFRILHQSAPTDQPPMVSIAKNYPAFLPCRRWWPPDRLASAFVERIFNTAFLDALTEGRWRVPGLGTWRLPEARATLDFLGVNFYGRQFCRWIWKRNQLPEGGCDLAHHVRDAQNLTRMGWEIFPPGFSQALLRGSRLGVPILVTENGAWTSTDAQRWEYIRSYVAAMARAMEQGARVLGYLYWSLLDNFEWAKGFEPRFGLIEMDYATQERRIRESARQYAEICRTNTIQLESV